MSRFCNLDLLGRRFVNLDHVQTIDLAWTKDDQYRMTVTYANGKRETLHSDFRPNLEALTTPVVPALPGFERLTFGFYDEQPELLTVADVLKFYNRDPIVAWRITGEGPQPVSLDKHDPTDGLVAILRPDGVVVIPEGEAFEKSRRVGRARSQAKAHLARKQKGGKRERLDSPPKTWIRYRE